MRLDARHVAILSAVLLGSGWGCGSTGPVPEPALVPVKGKVTYKGKPLTQGTIEFEPQTGGRLAKGVIQSDGTFTLTTTQEGDGVATGTHVVSVRATGGDAKKEVVPLKYTQAASSGYQVEVSAEKNELAINFK
ncbi:MAG: hypothetical protein P4L84_13255 [Isosphaeraceae bacterium]|nr:hypothetical protein [Isosphaeraceae bacterium]